MTYCETRSAHKPQRKQASNLPTDVGVAEIHLDSTALRRDHGSGMSRSIRICIFPQTHVNTGLHVGVRIAGPYINFCPFENSSVGHLPYVEARGPVFARARLRWSQC